MAKALLPGISTKVQEHTAAVLIRYSRGKKWFTVPGIISFFLLQHVLQGWCPPLPFFRKLSICTAAEINQEITALKYLRGIFEEKPFGAESIYDTSRLN